MTTGEREITDPVDLCAPDGMRLSASARGWSRRPLHRANLATGRGDAKRWDYWAVLAGDLSLWCVVADLETFALVDVGWIDLAGGLQGGAATLAAPGSVAVPDRPGTDPIAFVGDGIELSMADDGAGTRLRATWSEDDGRPGAFDVAVALPPGHESLNVVVPWSDELYNFTSKHQARPAVGTASVGERRWEIGPQGSGAWGVLDVGRGRWPHEIAWNWGGGAGRCGAHVIGLQVGARWTEGTGATENGVLVDGRLSKIGRELAWTYEWDEPLRPWRVVDPGGQLEAVLTPRYDKHSAVDAGPDLRSETHQVFGTWAGRLRTDDGTVLDFEGVQGFAEEARQRW